MRPSILSLIFTLAMAGMCATAVAQSTEAPPPTYQPVPAAPNEAIPPPPPQGVYIWRPGHWKWNGYTYHWVRGAYVLRRPGMHEWVGGAWAWRGGAWVWVPPHWR